MNELVSAAEIGALNLLACAKVWILIAYPTFR